MHGTGGLEVDEDASLYTSNTWKITVLKLWIIIPVEKEMDKYFMITQKW